MKQLLAGLLVSLFVINAVCAAEVMMKPGPLGAGKSVLSIGAKVDQNYFDMGSISALMLDSVGYGLTDSLDLYGSVGLGFSQKATDKPRTMDAMTMLSLGAGLKLSVFTEKTRPFGLDLMAGIKAGSQSKSSMNSWQYYAGLIASKKFQKLLAPYAGITYRDTRQNYGDFTQIDYTLGAACGPEDWSVLLEDTLQTVSFGGSTFQSNQFLVSFGLRLN